MSISCSLWSEIIASFSFGAVTLGSLCRSVLLWTVLGVWRLGLGQAELSLPWLALGKDLVKEEVQTKTSEVVLEFS